MGYAQNLPAGQCACESRDARRGCVRLPDASLAVRTSQNSGTPCIGSACSKDQTGTILEHGKLPCIPGRGESG